MSIWDSHYAALHAPPPRGFGKPAVLTLASLSDPVDITAIPKVGGAVVDPPGTSVEIQTIRPAADVRMSELTALGITDLVALHRGQIELAGKVWRIETWVMKPSPEGEANGEVRLVLSEAAG
jgi:hypothetical protein